MLNAEEGAAAESDEEEYDLGIQQHAAANAASDSAEAAGASEEDVMIAGEIAAAEVYEAWTQRKEKRRQRRTPEYQRARLARNRKTDGAPATAAPAEPQVEAKADKLAELLGQLTLLATGYDTVQPLTKEQQALLKPVGEPVDAIWTTDCADMKADLAFAKETLTGFFEAHNARPQQSLVSIRILEHSGWPCMRFQLMSSA